MRSRLRGGFVAAALLFWKTGTPSLEVADAISRDRLAAFAQMIVAGSGLLAVGISYSSRRRVEHVGEYYALLATCGGGMAFLVSASNLMTLFRPRVVLGLPLRALRDGSRLSVPSLEAGLKYLIVGSFGSGVLLFGSALIYGATGELGFAAIAEAVPLRVPEDDPLPWSGSRC